MGQGMSTKPYQTDFRNQTIKSYRAQSNDRCLITEPDRNVIEKLLQNL